MNKSTFQNVSMKLIAESKTNPRGTSFEGPEFNDLVASIQGKGIIVPLILRPAGKGYEVVAGSRRFRAAQKLKLTEVPANIQELSDTEAQEVQIIENLQRADIHPIQEGEAYRQLAEKGKMEIEVIAAKVGKPVSYVKRRLILTDLTAESKAAYRSGKINAGQAEIVSRLDGEEQKKIVSFIDRRDPDMDELREEIQRIRIGKLTTTPPWKDHEAAVAAMAPCPECSKTKGRNLFGEGAANQCGDPTCFARRLAAHMAIVKQEYHQKKIPLTLVSTNWRSEVKGAKNRDDYRIANPHAVGADKCVSRHKALVVDGDDDLGKVIDICTDQKCPVHGERRSSVYSQTPQEKAARKRELARQKAKKDAQELKLKSALGKVTWPLSEKTMLMLLDVAMNRGSMVIAPVCRRHGIEARVSKTKWGTSRDFDKPLSDAVNKMSKAEKAKLLVEIVLEDHNYFFEKYAKML